MQHSLSRHQKTTRNNRKQVISSGVIRPCNLIFFCENYFFIYKLVARKLGNQIWSCPNCRFQPEKIKPLWHGKKKAVPFIIVLRQPCFFALPNIKHFWDTRSCHPTDVMLCPLWNMNKFQFQLLLDEKKALKGPFYWRKTIALEINIHSWKHLWTLLRSKVSSWTSSWLQPDRPRVL